MPTSSYVNLQAAIAAAFSTPSATPADLTAKATQLATAIDNHLVEALAKTTVAGITPGPGVTSPGSVNTV